MNNTAEAAHDVRHAGAWGATLEDWAAWQALGLTADLLPVVSDPTAKKSEQSKIRDIGKVPSLFNQAGEVVGMTGWTKRATTAQEVEHWAADSRLGICLRGRVVKGFDIDIADEGIADEVEALISYAADLPRRGRPNSGKRLLAFRCGADFPKRIIKTEHGNIELLSSLQQFIVCGTHPSGARYEWSAGTPAEIPELSLAEVDVIWRAVVDAFALPGGAGEERAGMAPTGARTADDMDDPRVDWLAENGHVLSYEHDGKVNINCPWQDGHTPGTGGETSTTYFPAGVGGFDAGHFRCLHASCSARTDQDFDRVLGYTRAAFDVVELTEEQRAEIAEQMSPDRTSVVIDAATGEVTEIVSPKNSDDSLALEFADIGQDVVRYTPGMGWMSAGEHHWGRDEHLHRMTLARRICREAAKLADKAPERKALASARTVNSIVSLAQSDTRLLVPAGAWDAELFMLNTPAGVVDLRTGTMRPRARDLVTRAARVSPDFAAPCPNWSRFIDAVCAGDAALIAFLQRMLGYMLTGDRREQKLFFIWGKGSNGKSTLGELLLWLLGGYGLKLSSAVLMQSPHDRHPTELAQLHGVRAAVSSELEEGQFFNESRVKELTGDDTLSARFMRGDFFEFAMTHKHLVIGNHKPRLKGGDPAMARRLVLIPFRAAFSGAEADQDMPAKLRAEAPAILAWMVRGAVAWCADGLALPAAVRAASDEYMADHNDVEQWMSEWCERSPEFRHPAGRLYESFARWKLTRGERAPSAVTWAERMSLIAGIQKIRSNGAHYTGVRISTAANSDAMVGADAAEFA